MLSRGAGQARSGQAPHAHTAHICEHQRMCRFRSSQAQRTQLQPEHMRLAQFSRYTSAGWITNVMGIV